MNMMRAGGTGNSCTVPQSLTAEAAAVVKQSVTLARRRGHTQVTPLHVATTLLSAPTGPLRTACQRSHSHPLQCKALELCFSVALNRLPTAAACPTTMLGQAVPQLRDPSISNALLAAFKRAQAHQRRGSGSTTSAGAEPHQQQPLLPAKIQLEQLIISILDDPSVSRVMKEAGFSSPQVKTNVEQAVQPSPQAANNNMTTEELSDDDNVCMRNQDVDCVVESLLMGRGPGRRRRSTVIVGECVGSMDRVARAAIERLEKGELLPEAAASAARNMRFIKIPIVQDSDRDGVERSIGEVRRSVAAMRRRVGRAEVILYLGDLKWITELAEQITASYTYNNSHSYCLARDMLSEIEKLIRGNEGDDGNHDEEVEEEWSGGGRWRVMGTATFQTYMRCSIGRPSLASLLGLQPLIIPAGCLDLSLISTPSSQSPSTSSRLDGEDKSSSTRFPVDGGGSTGANFESEVRSQNISSSSCCSPCDSADSTATLPSWLQKYKHHNRPTLSTNTINDQNCDRFRYLCKKRNSTCSSVHPETERSLTFSPTSSPTSSHNSGFSFDPSYRSLRRRAHQRQRRTPQTGPHPAALESEPPTFGLYIPEPNYNYTSNASSAPNSATSSGGDVAVTENMVPLEKLSHIMSAVSECRSGAARRKGRSEGRVDTWLFFEGPDAEAKEKTAREVARRVFGTATSTDGFVAVALSHFSAFTRADSTEDLIGGNKRCRDEKSCTYLERLEEAVSESPHRVFFLEDVEQADQCSRKGIKRAAERGMIKNVNGGEIWLRDAVVILSCESLSSTSRACSPRHHKQRSDDDDGIGDGVGETSHCLSLDLNIAICNNHDHHHRRGADDESVDEDLESTADIGLLECVDRRIVFNF